MLSLSLLSPPLFITLPTLSHVKVQRGPPPPNQTVSHSFHILVPWGIFELCSSVFGKRLHIQVCLFFLFHSGHAIVRFVSTVHISSHVAYMMWCAVVHSAGASVCAVCGVCSDSEIRNWHTIDRHQRSPAAQQCNQLLRTHLHPL